MGKLKFKLIEEIEEISFVVPSFQRVYRWSKEINIER